MSVVPGLAVSMVPPELFPADESTVTTELTAEVSVLFNNASLLRMHQHEMKVMADGLTLDFKSSHFKSERELIEEREGNPCQRFSCQV